MKTIKLLFATSLLLVLSLVSAHAQSQSSIEPIRLEICSNKTTNIVFPHAIVSVDRGSKSVLAQKAKGVENILQVKAASDTLEETNLSIVTADGKLNSFIVRYSAQPAILNLSLVSTVRPGSIVLAPEKYNEAEVQTCALDALRSKKHITGLQQQDFGISFELNGIFVHDEVLYCRIQIRNTSSIAYDVDQLRFYIRDQKKSKRTATQEVEIAPVYVLGDTNKIDSDRQQLIVFALPKFTIPDKKYLAVQLMEKNGGRHFELHVKNKSLLKAMVLPPPASEAQSLIRI